MRLWYFALLLLVGVLVVFDLQQGQDPFVLDRFTVASGRGYFPRALQLPNGEILAIMRGGAAHLGIGGSLEMIRSKDGREWGSPVTVIDGPYDDRNPAFGQLRDGTLVLAYSVLKGYDDSGLKLVKKNFEAIFVMRSRDFGETWELISRINDFPSDLFSPYGEILELSDGTILMNVYGYFDLAEKPYKATEKEYYSYLFRSRDGGQTWGDISLIGAGSETGLALLEDGSLIAATRLNEDEGIAVSVSLDEGYTWSTPRIVTSPKEIPADLLPVENALIMTYGKRDKPYGIAATISYDRGRNWDSELILVNNALNIDCGYPTSLYLGNRKILTLYYQVNNLEKAPASAQLKAVVWQVPLQQ